MQALQKAFMAENEYDKNACYAFILSSSGKKNDRNTQGFMPRGRQFAYIFKKDAKKELNHTIAHELGHGIFKLQHTFNYGKNILKEGSTNNLMDYSKSGTEIAKWQWNRINTPAVFINPFEGDERGESETSYGEYISSYIQEIRSLRYSGEKTFYSASFKYNKRDTPDRWGYPYLMDGKKYGNIRMWVNNYSPSVAIELSQISVEDHYVFVGNKSSAYLTFEVRDSDLRLSKDAARALGEYLNVSKGVYQKQVEKHLAKLPTTVNIILNYPICLLKEVNEARHLELFEKLMREEPTLNEIKARCIKKLFTAVNDEAQASRLIKHIISNEYDKELIKSISNMQSNIFSDIAEGFSQLYYTQNKAQVIEFGKNVQADNFYIWNPLGNVKEKYVSYAKNTTYSSIFD